MVSSISLHFNKYGKYKTSVYFSYKYESIEDKMSIEIDYSMNIY
jgi:hypothetical protein